MSTPEPTPAHQGNAIENVLNTIKTKANECLSCLDKELSQCQCANDFERRTGVPKTYVALGIVSIYFLLVFFNIGAKFLTSLLAFVYPAWASFKAIESVGHEDDTQWLTYWVVFGFTQIIEYFSDVLTYWFPFYYTFKTIFVLWLLLPQFKGAQLVYGRFLRPCLIANNKPHTE